MSTYKVFGKIVREHSLERAVAYWNEDGSTGIFNITYAAEIPGARVIGNGTIPAPLGVEIAPEVLALIEEGIELDLAMDAGDDPRPPNGDDYNKLYAIFMRLSDFLVQP